MAFKSNTHFFICNCVYLFMAVLGFGCVAFSLIEVDRGYSLVAAVHFSRWRASSLLGERGLEVCGFQ